MLVSNLNTTEAASIAVLPFVNMSPDPENEYFSDGMTEEIINALTTINGLKVIARTSAFAYKGLNYDIRKIGSDLGVQSVLEGSIRKSSNRVRVTAQLINATDGTHYWSRNFDRELIDIFELQDEISVLIADQIRENFGHIEYENHLVKQSTSDISAYELFLKGRYHQLKWNPDSFHEAIRYYTKATEADPKFARAYYGNMQCYGLLAMWGYIDQQTGIERSVDNFRIAQDLDKQLPEYHMSFVGRYFWGEWNYELGYQHLKLNIEQFPNYTEALQALAELALANEAFELAEEYITKALHIDPLSANDWYTLALIMYHKEDYVKSLECNRKALDINRELLLGIHLNALCYLQLHDEIKFKECISGLPDEENIQLLYSVFHKEKEIETETVKNWTEAAEVYQQLIPYELYILANSKHENEAIQLLNHYIAQRRGQLLYFKTEPLLKPLWNLVSKHDLYPSNWTPPETSGLFSTSSKTKVSISDEELEQTFTRLVAFMQDNSPYLDASLSLVSLANQLDIHPNRLSYIINERAEANFNEFVNRYRLEVFKERALQPEFAHLSIMGLALESGFNSKSSFNDFFRKQTGLTPREWIKAAKQR
ncbi:helix-turn-helix domain-containing protein [bacterium]|nr:MAG: helix-turn-helix domain-containing protein [bacterium]